MVGNVLIVGVEQVPIVGVAVAVTAGGLDAEEELILRAVLDEDVEVFWTTIECMFALQFKDWRAVLAVVHLATGLHPGVHIELLQSRHILKGIVGNAVGILLMNGERFRRLDRREQ